MGQHSVDIHAARGFAGAAGDVAEDDAAAAFKSLPTERLPELVPGAADQVARIGATDLRRVWKFVSALVICTEPLRWPAPPSMPSSTVVGVSS